MINAKYQCYVQPAVEEMPTEVKEMLPTGDFLWCKQWGDSNEDKPDEFFPARVPAIHWLPPLLHSTEPTHPL